MTPNCRIRVPESYPSQPSTSLPSEIRTISIPGSVTRLPVGAMPASSPWWVPVPVQRVATRSPLGDLILDLDVEVGEGRAVRADVLLESLRAVHVLREGGVVVYVVGREELVRHVQVSFIEHLLEHAASERLIFFCGHRATPFPAIAQELLLP
jgi:hypothetical protein